MALKHQEQIDRLSCDLTGFSERDGRDAYCFTFEDITDIRNFVPRAIAVNRDTCTAWGLSFFETADSAKNRLLHLTANKEFLFKKLGSHIANGTLKKSDGISDDCNAVRHFTHFEYENVDLRTSFKVIIKVA